ncbi:hypothetical protein KW799_02400, partial [Candidatus Parcubacteria bacterium]|nr:hypothetical protein [Candidatus Parcubacteria bacterium]
MSSVLEQVDVVSPISLTDTEIEQKYLFATAGCEASYAEKDSEVARLLRTKNRGESNISANHFDG